MTRTRASLHGKHTAKSWPIDEAPARVRLLGDKTVQLESADHIIEFPGGAIEVARTSDGDYWAHIIVHRGRILDNTRESARGEIVASRLTCDAGVLELPDDQSITQIAVLVRPGVA